MLELNGMNVGVMNDGQGRLVCRTHPEENIFMTGTRFGLDGQRYVVFCRACGPVSYAAAADSRDMQAGIDELAAEIRKRNP